MWRSPDSPASVRGQLSCLRIGTADSIKALAIGALPALAACGPTKRQLAAQCQRDADHHYGAGAQRMMIAEYVRACMAAHGYELRARFDCGETDGGLNGSCYRWAGSAFIGPAN
jgi:hypothetical protein